MKKKSMFFLLIKVIYMQFRKFGKYRKAQRKYHLEITTDYILRSLSHTLNTFQSFYLLQRIQFWRLIHLLMNREKQSRGKVLPLC